MTDDEALAERVADLEDAVEFLMADRERYREDVVKPRLADLEAARDDAREQRVELQDALATLRERVRDLEVGIDSVIGLADDQQGGPAKRCADLRLGLIRAAEAKPDSTVAAKHWRDVQEFLAEHGHGKVTKPDCYDAMSDAAAYDGFELREKALTMPSGRAGRGVFVDTDKLPNHVDVVDSSVATTRNGGETADTVADD